MKALFSQSPLFFALFRGDPAFHSRHAEGEGRIPQSRHPGAYTPTGQLKKGWFQVGMVVAPG